MVFLNTLSGKLLPSFPTIKSVLPSPSKSPAATELTALPMAMVDCASKLIVVVEVPEFLKMDR